MIASRPGEAARRTLGLGVDGPVPDLLRQLEDEAALSVFIVPLGEDGIEGAYQKLERERFVLVNQDRHPVRKRFSLAHEFGHDYLGHGSRFDRGFSFSDEDKLEREANWFAAELLAPRPAIDHWFSRHGDPEVDLDMVVRLANFFNVSAFVVRYRLENEGRLTSRRGKELDAAIYTGEHRIRARQLGLSPPHDSITAQHARGAYVPAEMQARIGDLLRRELITEEAAASLLRVSADAAGRQIREMVEPQAGVDEATGG
jgi:Zn-dependent peptidase ImmA (M78 family)